jgi:DNA-binding NarL/FixJ family response regulator
VLAQAQDYCEALKKINEFRPDIAIIDLYLKNGKEGIDILRYVKDFLPGIKTIVMTYEDQEAELRCVHELSPDELLIKPVRSQALDAKINGLIKSIRN